MTNPLLTPFTLPPFSAIKPEHVVPAVTEALNDVARRWSGAGRALHRENLVQPLAEVDDRRAASSRRSAISTR